MKNKIKFLEKFSKYANLILHIFFMLANNNYENANLKMKIIIICIIKYEGMVKNES